MSVFNTKEQNDQINTVSLTTLIPEYSGVPYTTIPCKRRDDIFQTKKDQLSLPPQNNYSTYNYCNMFNPDLIKGLYDYQKSEFKFAQPNDTIISFYDDYPAGGKKGDYFCDLSVTQKCVQSKYVDKDITTIEPHTPIGPIIKHTFYTNTVMGISAGLMAIFLFVILVIILLLFNYAIPVTKKISDESKINYKL